MTSVFDAVGLGRRRLPVVLAVEGAECGLACLAMVGRYHGHDIDLNGLRQRFPLSLSGASLRNLMDLAGQLGFGCRALKAPLSKLDQIALPAIVHWDLDHFVVLKSVGRDGIEVHDPARGARRLSIEEASKHFTGVVLELETAAEFDRIEARTPIKINSLWSKSTGVWSSSIQVIALSVVLQLATFAAPFQMQLVVDEAVGRNDADLLMLLAVGFGCLAVLQTTIDSLRSWSIQVFGNLLSFHLTGNLVRHLLKLPAAFFEKRHVGDILSRMGSSSAIKDAITQGVVSALIDGAMAIIALAILLTYSPLLTLVVLIAVALTLALAFAFYPFSRARNEQRLFASAMEQSYLMETVRAAATIKVMGREAERESGWRNLYANVVNATLRIGRLQVSVGWLQNIIMGLQGIIVLFLAARMVIAGSGFSIGMLFAFSSFRQTFSDRTLSFINQAFTFRMLGLHLERLSDIVTAAPEVADGEAFHAEEVEGRIAARGLSFRYGMADPLVLKDISLDIPPGDFLAITGPSGSGKSTLLKLLLGLQTPTDGHVLLDGREASPRQWRSWRRRVGFVAQDDRLLSGTIAENIGFFDPALDMDAVRHAARAAQIHDDITRMPLQYLARVGDMGSALSGGQKQRILLARALYREPTVLFLDEGTANLDAETEEAIAALVASLPMTRVVVAHRPALVQRARRVAVIRNGDLYFPHSEAVLVSGAL